MIEVKENVFWDETAQRQSDEAMQWLHEDIMPRYGLLKSRNRPCAACV